MVSTDSTWTKLCTYTTVKKCQIVDAKIALSHKAVMLGVLTYIVVNLIVSHGYMKQEAPSAVVNAYVDEADYYAHAATLAVDPPAYCDNPDTDYTYSDSWTYEDNTCDFSLRLGDVLAKTESAVFITTYFQDTPVDSVTAKRRWSLFLERVCARRGPDAPGVGPPGVHLLGRRREQPRDRVPPDGGGGGELGRAPDVPGGIGRGRTPS
jgi:hypothetical protein